MRVSIITINYNDVQGLERTIKSVQEQTATNYEHIIIDGGSTDASKELMESYKNNFSFYSSEPDHGVYDAMNKGILKATGDYLLFLNSGDTLWNNQVMDRVFPHLTDGADIVYGNLFMVSIDLPSFKHTYPSILDFNFFKNTSLGHPATFIKKELFDVYGHYRTDLKIVSDWAFFLRTICIEKVSYKKIDVVVSNFYEGGISTSADFTELRKQEIKTVLLDHYDLYDSNYDSLIKENNSKAAIYNLVHPQIGLITTNKTLLKILNKFISLLSFILRKKRSL
jgi:glycosyltransferase involved in cell wall biosynthesis